MLKQEAKGRKRIAIIGAGISGLSAAYYLSPHNDVTMFEAAPRLGGHARTVLAGKNGDQPVDTGFIVFNYVTYPYLTRLFRDLDVPVIKSEMSFGVSIDNGRIEYGLKTLRSILAQKSNLLRPGFYRMIADIIKFGKQAEKTVEKTDMTIGELVNELGLGQWFRTYYLMPMVGAIWSTPSTDVDRFPARALVRFFRNHALLADTPPHQWWTVKGGSVEYVRRIEAALVQRGCKIHTATPVTAVQRLAVGVVVKASNSETEEFDEVIFACHSDQALGILQGDATTEEAEALGSIRYQPNRAVLHCDPSQMPKRRASWSSWIYRSQAGAVGVTYWMNRLQAFPEDDLLFVTLNPAQEIPRPYVYDEVTFAHPVFDQAALLAQERIRAMQGKNRTWFVGAYNRHGFHEDGIASALRVVRLINKKHPQREPGNVSDQQSAKIAVPCDL